MPVTNYFLQQEDGSYILQEDNSKLIIGSLSCPDAPTASVIQPICAVAGVFYYTGSIIVTSPLSGSYSYSIDNVNYQSSPTFSYYPTGSYPVTVKDNDSGCISTIVSASIRQTTPPLPIATVTQPNCTISTGTITMNTPSYSSSFTYTASQAAAGTASYSSSVGIFTNLPSATSWNLTITDQSSGCTSPALNVVVNAAPAPFTSSVGEITSSILLGGYTASIYQGQTASFTLGPVTNASFYYWTVLNLAGNYVPTSSFFIATGAPLINLTGSVVNTSTLVVTAYSSSNPGGPTYRCATIDSGSSALITVNAIPVPIDIVTPVTYNQGDSSVPLVATASLTGSSLLWYTTGSGGVGTPTAPTPSTSIAGTQTYYVTTFLNGYESSRAPVVVQVNEVASATPSVTPTPTVTPSITTTPSTTPSVSISNTPSITPTVTPSISVSTTPSVTPSISPSNIPSVTPTVTPSVTPTRTPSVTPTITPSLTPTPTPSSSPRYIPETGSVPYKLGLTGETTIYVNEVKCRVSENDFNYSQNPTVFKYGTTITGSAAVPFYSPQGGTSSWGLITDGTLADNVTGSSFHPYATTIGLYNDAGQLLVVGKLGTPYPIPSNTDITFIVRWDS